MRYRRTAALLLMLLLSSTSVRASCTWPAWEAFKRNFIDPQGRVIDRSDPRLITTSEGQSYALFFALVAGDQPTFRRLLRWTETHLAHGDLATHLPAWLWGLNKTGQGEVLDSNSAADSDLWIAYTLSEAGRLWKIRDYQSRSALLLQQIIRHEVATLPQLGPMLLPGAHGFHHDDSWTLNPSYLPPFIIDRLAAQYPHQVWAAMRIATQRLLQESAPRGFAPNWINWTTAGAWQEKSGSGWTGSYDAIRVYLWVGMLDPQNPQAQALQQHFAPMADYLQQHPLPPESINTRTLQVNGDGPVGFSAALLPLLSRQSDPSALQRQQQRVEQQPPAADAYYNTVLTLFGQGWLDGRYRFSPQGELILQGSSSCQE